MSELLFEISNLSISQRLELVQTILRGIAVENAENAQFMLTPNRSGAVEKQTENNNDEDIFSEWSREQINMLLQRRDEVLSGNAKTIPAEEVKAKLAAKYGLQN